MVNRVLGSTMENQGSTCYVVIQLSVVRTMPGLQHHTSYSFVWVVSGPCGPSWFSVRNVRPWYRAFAVPF